MSCDQRVWGETKSLYTYTHTIQSSSIAAAYPHCAIYTGSITHGISFTNVMAPVMWYNTCTSLICSHGIGKFSSNFNIACGMYFNALGWSSQQLLNHIIYTQHTHKILTQDILSCHDDIFYWSCHHGHVWARIAGISTDTDTGISPPLVQCHSVGK